MKIYHWLALVGLFLCSCGRNKEQCNISKPFRDVYFKSLSTIEISYESRTRKKLPYDEGRAFIFLGYISGHHSNRNGSHFGLVYLKKEDYELDMHYWKNWFEENKCHFSIQTADSIFSSLTIEKGGASNWLEYLEK